MLPDYASDFAVEERRRITRLNRVVVSRRQFMRWDHAVGFHRRVAGLNHALGFRREARRGIKPTALENFKKYATIRFKTALSKYR